jgi:hypothetical protein
MEASVSSGPNDAAHDGVGCRCGTRAVWRWLGLCALCAGALPMLVASKEYRAPSSPAKSVLLTPARSDPAPPLPALPVAARRTQADFGDERPSRDARMIADWAVRSADHGAMPFLIVDKRRARVYAFNAGGALRGSAPALLGLARGDESVPGIGERKMSDIRPHERTTPAGRFVAEPGRNTSGEDIVWVDYDSAVSMHRVRANNPRERRLTRLSSPTPSDNRISYGCINVPVRFYEKILLPTMAGRKAVVYVLPDSRSTREVFGVHDAEVRAQPGNTRHDAAQLAQASVKRQARPKPQ